MLNNKGFAVSAVLYTLLIAFLLFLGVTLANFSASANIISNANKDLINGQEFSVKQVKEEGLCFDDKKWYDSNTIVQIKSRYGTYYWPKDFSGDFAKETSLTAGSKTSDNKISSNSSDWNITFKDEITSKTISVTIDQNICD